MKRNLSYKKIFALSMMLIVSIWSTALILSQSSGSGTVTVVVNTPPTITAVTLYDGDNGVKTTPPATSLTPANEMTLEINVSEPNLADGDYISQVIITFYFDSGTGAPATTSPDLKAVYTLQRTSASDPGTWSVDDGLPATGYDTYKWLIDLTYSNITEDATTGNVTIYLVFTPSPIAQYSATNNWVVNVTVIDSLSGKAVDTSLTLNCDAYSQVTLSPTSLEVFIAPDNNAYLAGNFSVSVISNHDFYLQFRADNWTLSVTLADLQLYVDDDNVFSDATDTTFYQVTTTYGPSPGWGVYNRTTWDGTNIVSFSLTIYVFVVASTTVPSGTYTTTLYILATL